MDAPQTHETALHDWDRAVIESERSVIVARLRAAGAGLRALGFRTVCRRIVYWSPVALALIAFGQVSIRGLRPALSEARRLHAADDTLTARHAEDVALASALELQLRVRHDPIYVERQRRLARTRAPLPGESAPGSAPRAADRLVSAGG